MSAGLRPREQRLAVLLGGERLGLLEDRTLGFVSFRFDDEIVERYAQTRPEILSVGLSVAPGWLDPLRATPFFAGLLPEGEVRERIAAGLRLAPTDTFGLLAELGRESAGALVIVPDGEPQPPADAQVRRLSEAELEERLSRLGDAPLGVTLEDDAIRLSLAGAQDKLPVVVDEQGAVGLPLHGHPSTHILKPSSRRRDRDGSLRFPDLVANEAFCLRLAAELGLPTARARTLSVAGEPVLCVERYDRAVGDGRVDRIHQEDACQALAVDPANKYEAAGGPSLAAVGELLGAVSAAPVIDLPNLYRLTLVNALVGNADAHAKNVSLLHTAHGVRLAPAYDLVSTAVYAHTDRLAMRIAGAERLRDLDARALVEVAEACRVPARAAARVRSGLAAALPAAIGAAAAVAAELGPEVVARIVGRVEATAALLRAGTGSA